MLTIAIGLVALTGLLALSYYLSTHFLAGWYCFLAANTLGFALGYNSTGIVGINLNPSDFINLALLIAGAMRFSVRFRFSGIVRLASTVFFIVYLCSLVRGMFLYGFFAPSNESRGFIGEILGMLYLATIPTDSATLRKVVRAFLWFGGSLVGIAVLHYMGFQVGQTEEANIGDERNRAVPSSAAQAIAICFFLSLGWMSYYKVPRWFKLLPPVFAGMAIVLQHRTVWNVLIVCSLTLFFLDFKMLKRLAPTVTLAGVVGLGIAVGVYGSSDRASDMLANSASDTGTWDWRVRTWTELIVDQNQDAVWVLIGRPLGSPLYHYDQGSYEAVGPHNDFVALYLNFGIVGLGCFLIFMFSPLLPLLNRQRANPTANFPSSSSWYLVVIATAVYGITYQNNPTGTILLGIANAIALAPREAPYSEGEQSPMTDQTTGYLLQS
jgi:hypothetical protein